MDIVEWSEGIGMIAIGEVGGETNAIVTVFFGSSEKRGWEKNKEERIRWMVGSINQDCCYRLKGQINDLLFQMFD